MSTCFSDTAAYELISRTKNVEKVLNSPAPVTRANPLMFILDDCDCSSALQEIEHKSDSENDNYHQINSQGSPRLKPIDMNPDIVTIN